MKKKYSPPNIIVSEIGIHNILAGSGEHQSDETQIEVEDDEITTETTGTIIWN